MCFNTYGESSVCVNSFVNSFDPDNSPESFVFFSFYFSF